MVKEVGKMFQKRSIRICTVLAACLGLMACIGQFYGHYGQILPSADVTRAFEAYQVNPDFRYYTSGSDVYPNAVIGLHKDYRLDLATLWKEVELTPEKMKGMVQLMRTKLYSSGQYQQGFDILDDKGKSIGFWYSILSARTSVRINDDGTVRIDTPPLDTYEKNKGNESRIKR